MKRLRYVLGLDSGGSKTVVLLTAYDGEVVACGRGRGVANASDDPAVAARLLAPVVRQALAFLPPEAEMVAAYGCLGGLNVEAVRQGLGRVLEIANVAVRRESSGEVVFACAPHWGFDIAVMAGTGSIALGLNARGDRRVVGGWGALIHDRGSGYTVGRHALQAIAEALDFRGERTELLPALSRTAPFDSVMPPDLDVDTAPGLMTYEQRLAIKEAIKKALPALDRPTIAGMFQWVVACAERGDETALRILQRAGRDLADLVCALAAELVLDSPTVFAMGGVFGGGACILEPFREAVQARFPNATVQRSDFELVTGAALVALERAGLAVNEEVVRRLRITAARQLSAGNG